MSWYNEFGSVFFITIASIITGSIGLGFKYCIRSKCSNFSCCYGLLVVNRNVDIEAQEEIKEMELGIRRRDLSNPKLNIEENKI